MIVEQIIRVPVYTQVQGYIRRSGYREVVVYQETEDNQDRSERLIEIAKGMRSLNGKRGVI
jgi:hypothetical protein